MTIDNVVSFVVVAVVVIATIAKRFGGVQKRYGAFVAQQREAFMQQAAALEQAVAAQQAAAQAAARQATPQRAPVGVAAMQQRRPAPGASAAPPASARRTTQPTARSTDVPAAAVAPRGPRLLGGAFGDAAHARTAIVLAEILGPPVALR